MANSFRRVIQRPSDVEEGDWARLAELIGEAVSRQRDLAADSPNILQYSGDVQPCEDGSGLYIEHEPATAMPLGGLFDADAPAIRPAQLLRLTAAVFGALRTAHGGGGSPAMAHGAVCPGSVLFAPDGVTKLTDFGFASAFCEVLGEESYINMAVGIGGEDASDTTITGTWEVLARDEFGHDGRICAFIDPEKYGSQSFNAFEPASDVISAAFVLHPSRNLTGTPQL